MSELEVHRAIVHSADPATGVARVYIPEILGAGQTIEMPTTGLINTDGFWNVPSPGSHAFVAVTEDRAHYLWLTGIAAPGSSSDPGNEPIGHEDRTQSLMSFNSTSRTFTIQPTESKYIVWCVGHRYEKTAPESIQIPNDFGLYYIYFDSQGRLQYRTSFFVWDQDTPTAYVFWNGSQGLLFDERHGVTLDWQTHEYLHRTRGAVIANGLQVSEYLSTSESVEVQNGTFFDEDLQVDIVHSLSPSPNTWEQQLQGPARIPVMYRSGVSNWLLESPSNVPFKMGMSYPLYNVNSGGDWNVTTYGSNKHGIQWIVATNMLNYPVVSIMGQQEYNNIDDAREQTWEGMDFTGLPFVELRVLAKIIFVTNGLSDIANIEIEEISDYRRATNDATSSASAVVSHSDLTDLGSDDHPQYLTVARGDSRYYTETESDNRYLRLVGGTLTGQLTMGAATSIRQPTSSTWSGDPGAGVGKLEYHSNRWYIVAGSDSTELLRIRQNNSDKFVIANDGSVTVGTVPWARLTGIPSYSLSTHTHSYYATGSSVRALYFSGYGNSEVTIQQTSGNWQTWTGGWATHIICNHGDGSNYYNQTLIMPFFGPPQYMRKQGGSNSGPWVFYTSENANNYSTDWYGRNLILNSQNGSRVRMYGETHSMGVQNASTYIRTSNTMAFYRGGSHSDVQYDPGSGGVMTMYLDYYGSIYVRDRAFKPNGGTWENSSDVRLKKNISDYSGGLALLNSLRPVSYEWDASGMMFPKGTHIGLIAQEVEQVHPEWVGLFRQDVTRDSDGEVITDSKSLSYTSDFNAIVISAIKELSNKVDELSSRLAIVESP